MFVCLLMSRLITLVAVSSHEHWDAKNWSDLFVSVCVLPEGDML